MLSIVIVTHNSREYVKACLDSVYAQLTKDVEVVLVDNASADVTGNFVGEHYPWVRLIENASNEGACRARNQAIACSAGDWVLTLDSDVVIKDDFIKGFLSVQNDLPDDVGMVQPNVLNMDGETVYSHGVYLSAIRRFHDVDRGRLVNFFGPGTRQIIGPCSAAAFYRRSMLEQLQEKTGYFDERFFFLVEDVDLAWRARRAGWKTVFLPQLACCHAGNGSSTSKGLRQYLCFRNRHLMISKNESVFGKVIVFLISLPYELLRLIHLALFNKYFWGKPLCINDKPER